MFNHLGLRTVNLLGKNASRIVFRDFAEFSSSIFDSLCYKEHVIINWSSVNSAATKHNISKNTECETDKN